jgi:hypothetical protein
MGTNCALPFLQFYGYAQAYQNKANNAALQHLWSSGVCQWIIVTTENPEIAGFYIYTYTST